MSDHYILEGLSACAYNLDCVCINIITTLYNYGIWSVIVTQYTPSHNYWLFLALANWFGVQMGSLCSMQTSLSTRPSM